MITPAPPGLAGDFAFGGGIPNGTNGCDTVGVSSGETGPTSRRYPRDFVKVNAPNVRHRTCHIEADYVYHNTSVEQRGSSFVAVPTSTKYTFRTDTDVPARLGVMLVGWGGNNGSTLTASLMANRRNLSWRTKNGPETANFYGSLVMASTVKLGVDHQDPNKEVYVPLRSMLPMVHPEDFVLGGWDISKTDMAAAMERAMVLEPDLQRQLVKEMRGMVPLPSIYYPDFIAANQEGRADNVIPGNDKWNHLQRLRQDIRNFKEVNEVEKVIVVWTANTERFSDLLPGVNDTWTNLRAAIASSHDEVSPSTMFAVASVLEGCAFINGSPQNTLVPGVIELAEERGVHVGGDDFKSGQTKLKSVLADFLVNAGIKPLSIVSFNHLGNNDGRNLSAPEQFRSKEISKSSVVDDMVESNKLLYPEGEKGPDHTVVIKYVPAVSDSKRALDEYYSEIFMGGKSIISTYNVCEDSLLATPLIIDLVLLTELFGRIQVRKEGNAETNWIKFHPVLSILSYMLKAPNTPPGAPVINSLTRQRAAIDNILRACIGLQPNNDMGLEHKLYC